MIHDKITATKQREQQLRYYEASKMARPRNHVTVLIFHNLPEHTIKIIIHTYEKP